MIARPFATRWWTWLCSATLGVMSVTAGAAPAVAQTPEVFDGCYVPGSGAVYLIGEEQLPTECAQVGRHVHVPFSWTDGAGAVRATGTPADGEILVWEASSETWIPTPPAASTTDHGMLTGLGDDDHLRYLLTDGVRNATEGFAVTGTLGTSPIPAEGAGVRLMWYPARAALRAGEATGSEWDAPNVGIGSVAFGQGTTASGLHSTALGEGARASGWASTAIGFQPIASGQNAMALGNGSHASGVNSLAFGPVSVATGNTAVAMGRNTSATGDRSFALGSFASSNGFGGGFVFGDASVTTPVMNTNPHQFMVRAAGGTIFYSNAHLTAGVSLAPDGSSWASVSDVNRKTAFRDLDGEAVLERIARMPIREWSYKAQGPSIRHVGPTAQDFYAAFGLGTSDTTITTLDADGIALRATQALERRTAELRESTAALKARAEALEDATAEIAVLRAEVAALRRELADVLSAMSPSERAPAERPIR